MDGASGDDQDAIDNHHPHKKKRYHRHTPQQIQELPKKFGDCFLLRIGQRNLVVVSSPELAKEVLHTQGVEFRSREVWRYHMASCRSGKSSAHSVPA
ncbi:hypothetical protein ACFX1W_022109 [Malus domestica]